MVGFEIGRSGVALAKLCRCGCAAGYHRTSNAKKLCLHDKILKTCLSICHRGLAIQSVSAPHCRMSTEGGWHNQRNTGSRPASIRKIASTGFSACRYFDRIMPCGS